MAKSGTVKSSLKYFKLDYKKQAHPFVRFSLSNKKQLQRIEISKLVTLGTSQTKSKDSDENHKVKEFA